MLPYYAVSGNQRRTVIRAGVSHNGDTEPTVIEPGNSSAASGPAVRMHANASVVASANGLHRNQAVDPSNLELQGKPVSPTRAIRGASSFQKTVRGRLSDG